MPEQLALRSNRLDKCFAWLKFALILAIVMSLAIQYGVPFADLGLHWMDWRRNLVIGIGASMLHVCVQGVAWRLLTSQNRYLPDQTLLQESGIAWAIFNLVSVLAQEVWIAFCLVALKQAGHPTVTSVALVAMVFGVTHIQYKLGAAATSLYGVGFACLFLWRGSLLPSFIAHYVGNIASRYWSRRSERLLKDVQA